MHVLEGTGERAYASKIAFAVAGSWVRIRTDTEQGTETEAKKGTEIEAKTEKKQGQKTLTPGQLGPLGASLFSAQCGRFDLDRTRTGRRILGFGTRC